MNLFVVEDHPVMRDALAMLIGAQPGLQICGFATSGEQALAQLPGEADLVLVDVSLPGMNGLELVRQMRERWPALPCLVLSGHSADRYAEPAREAGAIGYVMKDDADGVVQAIREALAAATAGGSERPGGAVVSG